MAPNQQPWLNDQDEERGNKDLKQANQTKKVFNIKFAFLLIALIAGILIYVFVIN